MPAVQRRWTAEDVRALIAESPLATPRYELVEGELLVTPSPNIRHQEAVALLLIALREYLGKESIGHALMSPSDIELEPEFLSQPDVFVIPHAEYARVRRVLPAHAPARALLLAVEVLSPSSGRHDRVRKRPLYQRHVPEYWIVDTDAEVIERWRSADVRAESIDGVLTWMPAGAASPFMLDLGAFFNQVRGDDG